MYKIHKDSIISISEKLKINHLCSFARTCKRIYKILKPLIDKKISVFHIFVRSFEKPDLIDENEKIYTAFPIGNFMWKVIVKTKREKNRFIYYSDFIYYEDSSRFFEENNIYIPANPGVEKNIKLEDNLSSLSLNIYYPTNFGEFLQVIWVYDSWPHPGPLHHTKLSWSEGNVWTGQLVL